jgi:hypothetical protein
MSGYTVLIRAPGDPERAPRRSGSDPNAWRKKVSVGTAEEWATRIIEHQADGEPRTFNRIMVEIAGVTADMAAQEPPERGLWLAVERGYLGWTASAPIYFKLIRPEGFRKRRTMAQPAPTTGSLGSTRLHQTKLELSGKFTVFDAGVKSREKWTSLGGFSSLGAAKDRARAWTVSTGRATYVFDRAEKLVYQAMFTPEMAKLYTQGWETPRTSRTGGDIDPGKRTPPIVVQHLGAPGNTGRLHYVLGRDPNEGYFGLVTWEGHSKPERVPLTSLAPAKGLPERPESPKRPKRTAQPERRAAPAPAKPPRSASRPSRRSGDVITADDLVRMALEKYRT